MKPITYQAQKSLPLAFVGTDGQTVCCGKCHAKIGSMNRLLIEGEVPEDRRLPIPSPKYDPVKAQARARIVGSSEHISNRGKVYFTFNEGYIQLDDGLFSLNSQPDERSKENSILISREKEMIKKAEKIWPKNKSLFEGEVLFRRHVDESKQPADYTETRSSEHRVVFDIFGTDEGAAILHVELAEKWNRDRQDDLRNKRRADELRDNAQFIAERRKGDFFLKLPPIPPDEAPIPAKCEKCNEDCVIVPKKLAADFEKWESASIAKATDL